MVEEPSCSNSSKYTFHTIKHPRHGNNAFSARLKGVVLQQNGNWGAQIYANSQRIWLGTFQTDKEAAAAYDSAAIKLRGRDTDRNFPWTDINIKEPSFQDHYNEESVIKMIRDGSYSSKYTKFLKSTQPHNRNTKRIPKPIGVDANRPFLQRQLFHKELTASDVGKPNRLVIPKKYAMQYFPISQFCQETYSDGGGKNDIQLVFYDRLMKCWKFRFCYWNSSQSFVFTKGWNRFVKEKELKVKDVISFHARECTEMDKEDQPFYIIDINYNNDQMLEGQNYQDIEMQVELQYDSGKSTMHRMHKDAKELNQKGEALEGLETTITLNNKSFKLFGVQIN